MLGHFVCLFVRSLVCMSVCLAGGLCSGRVRVEFSAVTMTTDQIQTCISCMPTKALLVIGCCFFMSNFLSSNFISIFVCIQWAFFIDFQISDCTSIELFCLESSTFVVVAFFLLYNLPKYID